MGEGQLDLLGKYYDKRTFLLYALFASVPGAKTWPRLLFITISVLSLTFSSLFQILKIFSEGMHVQVVIDLLPAAAPTLATLLFVPYIAYAANKDHEAIFSIMLSDVLEERNEEEEAIKRRYARKARIFVKMCTALLFVSMCGIFASGLIPNCLDLLMPLNESRARPRQLLYDGEMFVAQEEYFSLLYFLECCNVFVVGVLAIVSENMGVIVGQHYCGMFAVVGYNLEKITQVEGGEESTDGAVCAKRVEDRLVICIEKHQRSLQFSALVAHLFDIPLALSVASTFCALTATLAYVTDPQAISTKMVLFAVVQFVQFFVVNYIGQVGMDASERVSQNAYNANWCVCVPKVRRSLQMVILRSSKPCKIVARYLYTLSIENFMTTVQTITSCCMVLRQI